jgi:predicted phage tail protein
VNLTWTPGSGPIDSYTLQRSTDGGVTWTSSFTISDPAAAAYSDTTAQPATAYTYQLVANNVTGSSPASNPATATTLPLPPAAPSGLAATLVAGPRVSLTWTDNATNETGFIVQRSVNGGAYAQLATVAARSGTGSASYVDGAVALNSTYRYRVIAVNTGGSSAPSNIVLISVRAPNAPSSLTATIQGTVDTGPRMAISFRDNATNETGFRLYRRVNNGNFVLLATLPARSGTGTVTYTDSNIIANRTYRYYVVAVNLAGASSPSATVTVQVPPAPAAPSRLTAFTGRTSATTASIVLRWQDNSNNEQRFVVERSTSANFTTNVVRVNVSADTETLTQTNLPRGVRYYYRIQAQNRYGVSVWVILNTTSVVTP